MIYYESSEIEDLENCIFFRFTIENVNDCVIASKHDGSTGFVLKNENRSIKLELEDSTTTYILRSYAIRSTGFSFVEIAVNMDTGEAILLINGDDKLATNTVSSVGDISNAVSFKIGSDRTDGNGDVGNLNIGIFSFWSEDDWFTDLSEYQSVYNQYTLYYQNPSWPQAGPYAEQLVADEKIKYLETFSGAVNLEDEILINGITESTIGSYDSVDADELSGTLDNLSENGSGDEILYDQVSEFIGDRTLFYQGGKYLDSTDKTVNAINYHDIIIETTGRTTTENSTIFSKRDAVSGINLYYDALNERLILRIEDDNGVNTEHITADNSLENDTFFHVMVFIDRNSGSPGTAIYRNNVSSGSSQDISAYIDIGTDGYFILGYDLNNGGYRSDIYINTFRIWLRYKWLSASQNDEIVDQRYTDYQDGGIEYPASVPITFHTWGDNGGTIPMLFVQNKKTSIWELMHYSSTKEEKETTSVIAQDGIAGVRLAAKYETFGQANFDDIKTFEAQIESVQIPRRYRRVFRKIIMQSKPAKTWAGLMIEWV